MVSGVLLSSYSGLDGGRGGGEWHLQRLLLLLLPLLGAITSPGAPNCRLERDFQDVGVLLCLLGASFGGGGAVVGGGEVAGGGGVDGLLAIVLCFQVVSYLFTRGTFNGWRPFLPLARTAPSSSHNHLISPRRTTFSFSALLARSLCSSYSDRWR